MSPREIVLFDIDGTLTDTNALDDANIARAFREQFEIEIDVDWSRYRTSTDSGIAREILETALGRAAEPQELERLALRLSELVHETHGASPIQPMRGAAAAIAALEEAGFAVALASGGWKATAEAKLRAAGLDLDRLPRAFADDHEERRGIIETARARAATRLGADGFSRTVYVGDAIWDLVTTRDMRIPFVGIAAGAKGERLVADGAHHVLPDYSDGAAFMAAVRAARPPSGI
jgi:phosphoglycolate phosphatase-like HAD superfamily hydrolase